MTSRRPWAALATVAAALALAACGRATPAPVPVIDAPVSPGEPTQILVPVDSITPQPAGQPVTPAATPPTDLGAPVDTTDGAAVPNPTTPDLIGPAGDLGGGGGGTASGVTDGSDGRGLVGSPSPSPVPSP